MKVAIMVDGAFFQKKFWPKYRKNPTPQNTVDVAYLALEDVEFKDDILFRIYYYDCYPFDRKIKNPISGAEIDFSDTPIYKARCHFLRQLALCPRVALRSGSLSYKGLSLPKKNISRLRRGEAFDLSMLKDTFIQKQVDIKIGLDIAWISSKKIVDKIVIVTGDSDFIPAMKFARREGIMVYLVHFDHQVKTELKEHCDGIIEVSLDKL